MVYATLMGVQHYQQPMFVSSTYRITGIHYTYWFATISAFNVSKLFSDHYLLTP